MFLMSPSGDAGKVGGAALGQIMGLRVIVWLATEAVDTGQSKEAPSELWRLRGWVEEGGEDEGD